MTKKYLNGSTDLLAKAMRQVFSERMEESREGMKDDLDEGLDKLRDALGDRIDTTNENMQADSSVSCP